MTGAQTSSSSTFHPCFICADDERPVQPKPAGFVRLLHHEDMDAQHEDNTPEDPNPESLWASSWAAPAALPEPKSTHSKLKRQQRRQVENANLRTFLKTHGFSVDIHEPRTGKAGCGLFWTKTEEVYPIHVAAELGDLKNLRVLLRYGADPKEKTSKGRMALEMARKADIAGSHADVIHLLKEVQFVNVRDVLRMDSK